MKRQDLLAAALVCAFGMAVAPPSSRGGDGTLRDFVLGPGMVVSLEIEVFEPTVVHVTACRRRSPRRRRSRYSVWGGRPRRLPDPFELRLIAPGEWTVRKKGGDLPMRVHYRVPLSMVKGKSHRWRVELENRTREYVSGELRAAYKEMKHHRWLRASEAEANPNPLPAASSSHVGGSRQEKLPELPKVKRPVGVIVGP